MLTTVFITIEIVSSAISGELVRVEVMSASWRRSSSWSFTFMGNYLVIPVRSGLISDKLELTDLLLQLHNLFSQLSPFLINSSSHGCDGFTNQVNSSGALELNVEGFDADGIGSPMGFAFRQLIPERFAVF